jgi:hypothetical protein
VNGERAHILATVKGPSRHHRQTPICRRRATCGDVV